MKALRQYESYLFGAFVDLTAGQKLQRIRPRQRLPPLFLRKLRLCKRNLSDKRPLPMKSNGSAYGSRTYLEVTGPHVKVNVNSPLWIRPDKLKVACQETGTETWIVHVTPTDKMPLLRVIRCDAQLCERFKRGEFPIDHPRIRGREETYVSIPANDLSVKPIQDLYDALAEV
jgi:hypothetical protein